MWNGWFYLSKRSEHFFHRDLLVKTVWLTAAWNSWSLITDVLKGVTASEMVGGFPPEVCLLRPQRLLLATPPNPWAGRKACSNFESKVLALYWFLLEIVTIIIEMLHHVKCITYSDWNISILLIGMVVNCWGCLLSTQSCDCYTFVLLAYSAFFSSVGMAAVCYWLPLEAMTHGQHLETKSMKK